MERPAGEKVQPAMNRSTQNRAKPGFLSRLLRSASGSAKLFRLARISAQFLIVVLLGAAGIACLEAASGETDPAPAPDKSAGVRPARDAGHGDATDPDAGNSTAKNTDAAPGTAGAVSPTPNTPDDSAESADAALRAEIETRLSHAVIGEDGFQFTVRSGTVYWTGETAIAQHKGAATRMARSAGAKQVVNRIIVKGATSPPARQGRTTSTHMRKAVVRWRATQRH